MYIRAACEHMSHSLTRHVLTELHFHSLFLLPMQGPGMGFEICDLIIPIETSVNVN